MASDGFFHGSAAQHASWQELKRSPLKNIDRNAILVSIDTEGSGGQTGEGKQGQDDTHFAKSVGFSVLKLADVADIAPGPLFRNWYPHMKVTELMHQGWDHIHPKVGWVEFTGGLLNRQRSTRRHYTMPTLQAKIQEVFREIGAPRRTPVVSVVEPNPDMAPYDSNDKYLDIMEGSSEPEGLTTVSIDTVVPTTPHQRRQGQDLTQLAALSKFAATLKPSVPPAAPKDAQPPKSNIPPPNLSKTVTVSMDTVVPNTPHHRG
ncbi:MAG: hypothetical protein OHK93_008822 [Ramalina farinacea]|uniref:Uncharacterized protein n=1 Tax=Ramalina farinacea TaxID=258253 RepID=A0AA43TS78_9LECA|nr:hypothetical protein [Ramalina farinacea]